MLAPGNDGIAKKRQRLDEGVTPNSTLFFTITDPLYPITAEVVRSIFAHSGTVRRVALRVVGRGAEVHGAIEFESGASAGRAKERLHGANIYPGCCVLQVKYPEDQQAILDLYKNNNDCWELTAAYPSPPSGAGNASGGQPQALLPAPHNGTVLMIAGMRGKMNAQKLFNLLCVFGNVLRIQFMKKQVCCALVQMEDALGAERAAGRLNGIILLGFQVNVNLMPIPYVPEVKEPWKLADGSPSYMNFLGSNKNRYNSREGRSRDWHFAPSRVLYFYNVPRTLNQEDLLSMLQEQAIPKASITQMEESKSKLCKTGLIEFRNVAEAVEALVVSNNALMQPKSGHEPFILKLSFSKDTTPELGVAEDQRH
ncbi:heterogeneous nuclear ribonucleoprotein L-like [Haemaphysalis longicornis]